MIHLLAIRHAPVTFERVFYGQTDVPTTLTAAEAAARVGSTVAEFAPHTLWSSDAVRCREPAALLSERLGVPHRIEERVREMSYGDWEGRDWDAVPRAEIDEWMAEWQTRSHHRPRGVRGSSRSLKGSRRGGGTSHRATTSSWPTLAWCTAST